jgi:hypothetical protein
LKATVRLPASHDPGDPCSEPPTVNVAVTDARARALRDSAKIKTMTIPRIFLDCLPGISCFIESATCEPQLLQRHLTLKNSGFIRAWYVEREIIHLRVFRMGGPPLGGCLPSL